MSKRQPKLQPAQLYRPRRIIEPELDPVLAGWEDDYAAVNARPQDIVSRLKSGQEVYEMEDVPVPCLL